MNKTIYRIMGIIVTFALALGGFSKAEAVSSQPDVTSAASGKPVYAYYYLWWSHNHWRNKLGPNYPYKASPLPLPATTAENGCKPVSKYKRNQLLDVPTKLVSQDDPGAIEADIRLAKNAGITGFWLNWAGEGTTTQTRTSVTYTPRLAEAFNASERVGGFKNWVSYKAASNPSANYIINDLNFLYAKFKDEPAWERIDGKPVVTFTGSREYSSAAVQKISNAVRDRMYLVGDESYKTLTKARLAMFDAITYYWSTQDPYGNPDSFEHIREMADKVHAAGKRWYAPLNPGYNSKLLDGSNTCIPRKNGETLRVLWNGNLKSKPDGWGFISWNEIAENTHIKPMQKWGTFYLDFLEALIQSNPLPVAPTAVPTAVPTTKPTTGLGPGTVDDKNPAIRYPNGGWRNVLHKEAYKGSLRVTTKNGSVARFSFTGQSFGILYKGGPYHGKLDVYVDGALVGTIDQYSAAATHQQRWDYPGRLAAGNHVVRLVFKATSATKNKGSLDAVIIP